jgi:type VI protein secretion system component Hcp
VHSANWGHGQARPGTGAAAGKVQFSNGAITKPVAASSTHPALAAASGQSLPVTARLVFRRMTPNPAVFLEVPLTGVRAASYQVAGGDSALPTEQVQLSFATIGWT